MPLRFATAQDTVQDTARPVTVLAPDQVADWCANQPEQTQNWVASTGFAGNIGQAQILPDAQGNPCGAVLGFGSPKQRARGRFALAAGVARLPAGTYRLTQDLPQDSHTEELLGWLLTQYRFDRYRAQPGADVTLIAPQQADAAGIESLAAAEALTRDLINTPAADMGPVALESAVRDLGAAFGAEVTSVVGEDLLGQNFPMIHAVGRAAHEAPRLVELRWGTTGPALTLVGKGVCFDTGGLNLKPGGSMGLMKKDMGGAANVLGLARMIMAADWPLRLRVLIPAVENSVSANSFRPQDILTSRKGLTVEVNNTDAEGRLVLADALALADEASPDLVVSMATLTGAARVAVGPDLAPYFTDDPAMATALESASARMADPVWRMPFHTPYEPRIEPGLADLDNAPAGGMAGAITAALFLRRFVDTAPYTHFDIYGWTPTAAPARPKGGVGQGGRALFGALPQVLGL